MANHTILVRLLLNQATCAEQAGKRQRALERYGRMTRMAPGYGHAWWERTRLELTNGDVPAARNSLTAMREMSPEPDLRKRETGTLEALDA